MLDSTSDTIVRLQIWDTAGQERFRSISRLYYRGAHACLLCYDITDERSFQEMAGWLVELKESLPTPASPEEESPLVIHVVGTKSDIVALDPSQRRVPFERTIAYVAEQLYPTQASTPPPTAGMGMHRSSSSTLLLQSPDSKRSSGFWGQDIGWDCCHEISAKDGEGIEEVFRVIARKLVEQRNRREEAAIARSLTPGSSIPGVVVEAAPGARGRAAASTASSVVALAPDGNGSLRLGPGDSNSRSWLGFSNSSIALDEADEERANRRKGKCC